MARSKTPALLVQDVLVDEAQEECHGNTSIVGQYTIRLCAAAPKQKRGIPPSEKAKLFLSRFVAIFSEIKAVTDKDLIFKKTNNRAKKSLQESAN